MGFGPVTGKRNPRLRFDRAVWRTLDEDITFEGIRYAKGSRYKIFESENFGHVMFAPETLTPEGSTPGKLNHRM
jgi:hypothetical protein